MTQPLFVVPVVWAFGVLFLSKRLAEEYISPDQLAVFRSEVLSTFTDISIAMSHYTRVIEQLRQIVVTALQGNQVPVQSLRDIVDLMRKNETSFPHFRNSNTYKLFEPPVFKNKKVNHGYWFYIIRCIFAAIKLSN